MISRGSHIWSTRRTDNSVFSSQQVYRGKGYKRKRSGWILTSSIYPAFSSSLYWRARMWTTRGWTNVLVPTGMKRVNNKALLVLLSRSGILKWSISVHLQMEKGEGTNKKALWFHRRGTPGHQIWFLYTANHQRLPECSIINLTS